MFKNDNKKSYVYSRIGLRMSIYAVILSLLFALISISILVYIDSKKEKKSLLDSSHQVITTIERQLAKNLWDLDNEGIVIILKGFVQLPFIDGASLSGQVIDNINVGKISFPQDISRSIIFNDEEIGVLRVNINHYQLKQSLYEKYKTMAMNVTALIGLMGFIFYVMVNRSLIRHITYISHMRKSTFLKKSAEYVPLSLLRKSRNDELNDLVDVLNEGRCNSIELLRAKKEYQEQIEYQANFDELTGLPNRRHLYEHLDNQISTHHEDMGTIVVMFIDLDGFKQVNDSMGHSVGDHVLQQCATRLQTVTDTFRGYLSRLGGDEFIICFHSYKEDNFECEANRIIHVFDEKINTQGINVKLGCSIGITTYPNEHLDNSKQLIHNADSALYKAKDLGRNTFFCFNDDIRKEMLFEREVKNKLLHAVENNCFDIYYQPLINIQKNTITGFEALLRWHDDDLGWISPDIFIPIAEKMGVIFDIDTWVFTQAVKQVDMWRDVYHEDFIVSVNFSPTNFYHNKFISWVDNNDLIKDQMMEWVELEITERLVLNNDPIVLSAIEKLRSKGIQFSIDDFGIGYSSLGYIKNFSDVLCKIKIDQIFIKEILFTDFDIAFVKSIMMLSDTLNLKVLAEGVEEKGQVELLKKLGCKYVQGFYFSKPLPVSKVGRFIESWQGNYIPPQPYQFKNDYL
jgi:diguanylate cyclase (GGDEF)-like protein